MMRIPLPTFGRTAKDLLYSDLSNRAKVLWAILDEQSTVRTALSRNQLIELLGCSIRSLDRAIEELELAGWLTVNRVRGDDGLNRPNVYILSVVAREIGPAAPTQLPARRVERASPVATGATTPRPSPVATGATRGSGTGGALSTTRTTTENENYDFGGGTYVSSGAESNAPPKCAKHPNGPRHDENCRPCGQVRRWIEQPTPDPAVLAGKRMAQAISNCSRCDLAGWLPDDGGPARRCDHERAPDLATASTAAPRSSSDSLAYLRAQIPARAANK